MPQFPTTAIDAARSAVEALLLRLVEQTDPAAVVDQPMWPGATTAWPAPAPLVGVCAALLVEQVANSLVYRHTARARAEGRTWLEIAQAAGVDPEGSPDARATAMFALVAGTPASAWDEPTVWWRCPTCGKQVRDHGPDVGIYEAETGHDTCERRLAQLAAFQARRASDDLDNLDDDDLDDDDPDDEELDDEELDDEELDDEELDDEDRRPW